MAMYLQTEGSVSSGCPPRQISPNLLLLHYKTTPSSPIFHNAAVTFREPAGPVTLPQLHGTRHTSVLNPSPGATSWLPAEHGCAPRWPQEGAVATLGVHLWIFVCSSALPNPSAHGQSLFCSETLAEPHSLLDEAQSSAAHPLSATGWKCSKYALSCSVATNHLWPI